jgi:hypothetical protein
MKAIVGRLASKLAGCHDDRCVQTRRLAGCHDGCGIQTSRLDRSRADCRVRTSSSPGERDDCCFLTTVAAWPGIMLPAAWGLTARLGIMMTVVS